MLNIIHDVAIIQTIWRKKKHHIHPPLPGHREGKNPAHCDWVILRPVEYLLCIANTCGMRADRNTFRSWLHTEFLFIEQLFIVQLTIYNFLFICGFSYSANTCTQTSSFCFAFEKGLTTRERVVRKSFCCNIWYGYLWPSFLDEGLGAVPAI